MGLALALEARGRSCWIAPRDIPAGSDYPHEIVVGIQRTEAFLILLSPAAVLSKHILRELELAVSAGRKILPLRVGKVELNPSMTFLLAGVQWIEVTEDEVRDHPGRIAERICEGRGTRLGVRPPRRGKSRAVIVSALALTSLIAAGWAARQAMSSPPGKRDTDPGEGAGAAASEPVLVRPATSPGLEPGARIDPPPEAAVEASEPEPPPRAAELPLPNGRWVCFGKAAYDIEWDMTFSGDRRELVVTGNKSRVDGMKAQAGERVTTLTLNGALDGQKWSGRYAEKTKSKITEGRFEAEFSEDFGEFAGRIFTPEGTASSLFTGKAAP